MTQGTALADEQAERAVLGGMMLSADVADQVAEILTIADWYRPAHAEVYAAITSSRAAGEPVDPIAIAQRLAGAAVLAKMGGASFLHDLIATVPTAASAPYYARQLAELAMRRRVATAAVRIHQQAADLGSDTAEMVNRAQQELSDAAAVRSHREAVAVGDGLDDLIEQMCSGDADRGMSTGLGALDDVIGGLHGGQLIVIGGRPGVGKSVLGIDIARSVSIHRHLPSLVVSLEMSKAEVRKRLCAAECSIDLARLIENRPFPDEQARLRGEASRIGASPLYIADNATADLATIRAAARRVKARHGLRLLVVDYLQLIVTGGTGNNRAQEIGALSRGLKLLARDLDVPIVAAAQLNRESEARTDRRPQMSDLRESGAIEADADIVILLHRPDYHDPEHVRAGEIDLIVAKNRNGPQETVTAAAQLRHARIVDILQDGMR